jgi:hypothetical protein
MKIKREWQKRLEVNAQFEGQNLQEEREYKKEN